MDKNHPGKKILESIELPEDLDQLITESVEKGYWKMKKEKASRRKRLIKSAAFIITCIAAAGAISVPVSAYVTSVVKERMDKVPKEEMDILSEVLDSQDAAADSWSRKLTDKENEKYQSLSKAYNKGTFPKGELAQSKAKDSKMGDIPYFIQDTSTFQLPERELTDEELLQIIDFITKRDYALSQSADVQADNEARRKQQEDAKKKVASAGGLTESEAEKLGLEWIQKLYGQSEDGMTKEVFYWEDADVYGTPVYSIEIGIRSVQNSSVQLDVRDGSLVSANEIIVADDIEGAPVGIDVLNKKTDALYQKAKDVLLNQIGAQADYEKVILAYSDEDGYIGNLNRVAFFFIKADGSACEVGMSPVRDKLIDYKVVSSYEETKKELERRLEEGNEASADSSFAQPKGVMVYKEMK